MCKLCRWGVCVPGPGECLGIWLVGSNARESGCKWGKCKRARFAFGAASSVRGASKCYLRLENIYTPQQHRAHTYLGQNQICNAFLCYERIYILEGHSCYLNIEFYVHFRNTLFYIILLFIILSTCASVKFRASAR